MGLRFEMTIQTIEDDIGCPPQKPTGPRETLREIQKLVVGPIPGEVEVRKTGLPKPLDVLGRSLDECGVIGDLMFLHEAMDIALLDHRFCRTPDNIFHKSPRKDLI